MLLLTSTSDLIQVINGTTGAIATHASYTDLNSGTVTPGRSNFNFTTAATNTAVGSPGASTQRNVQFLLVRNTHASISTAITVQHTDGSTVSILYKCTLAASTQLIYDGQDFVLYDVNGNILAAAQATAQGSDKQIQYNNAGFVAGDANFTWDTSQRIATLGAVSAEPSAPSTGLLAVYDRATSGRQMFKTIGPAGKAQVLQPALFAMALATYFPSSSTNGGTATVGGYGISWTAGGTVSHPTPASGIINQIHRTRYANIVTTTNQTLGIIAKAAGLPMFWRGNSAGQGGFFFYARYIIELWPANTCRIFVGLSDSSTAQVTLDIASMTGSFCAFAHDTTDGANVMWFITRDNTTTHKTSLSNFSITAGQGYDFYIYCKPNDSTIYYRVDDINAGTTIIDTSETNNLPISTAMMGPEITMSNGTANTTVTTVAPGIARVYVESDN